ncbi:hypothetical protein D8B26_005384 [Coccidioides posadasii str. Silveira]|nr:hypothetical protein D8B26_005384 [Coccidioides posadasii str. Silveira]
MALAYANRQFNLAARSRIGRSRYKTFILRTIAKEGRMKLFKEILTDDLNNSGVPVPKPYYLMLGRYGTKELWEFVERRSGYGSVIMDFEFSGSTPLMLAAQYNSDDVVEWLLEHDMGAARRNSIVLTALTIAMRYGRLSIVKLLCRKVPALPREVEIADALGSRPDVFDVLLDAGAAIYRGAPRTWGHCQNSASLSVLARHKINLSYKDHYGKSVLHYAASGNPKATSFFVAHGLDPDLRDGKSRTPLYYAVNGLKIYQPCDRWPSSYIQVIEILIAAGADPLLPCENEEDTPLTQAYQCKNPSKVVRCLLPELAVIDTQALQQKKRELLGRTCRARSIT